MLKIIKHLEVIIKEFYLPDLILSTIMVFIFNQYLQIDISFLVIVIIILFYQYKGKICDHKVSNNIYLELAILKYFLYKIIILNVNFILVYYFD